MSIALDYLIADPSLSIVLGSILLLFFGAIIYGLYLAFGPPSKNLIDAIDEHSRMHELGIPHGHGGSSISHKH